MKHADELEQDCMVPMTIADILGTLFFARTFMTEEYEELRKALDKRIGEMLKLAISFTQ